MSAIVRCESGNGLFGTTGDNSYLMYDAARRSYKGAILALPGLNLGAYQWSPLVAGTLSAPGAYDHVRGLVKAGYVVLAIDGGSITLWPSPALNKIIAKARPILLSMFTFASTKIGLLGFSRGIDSSLDYLINGTHDDGTVDSYKANVPKVAGVFGFSGSPDLRWAAKLPSTYSPPYGVATAWATYQPEILTSFAATTGTFDTATTGYRMMDNASDFAGTVPIRLCHAVNDPTVPILLPETWVAAVNDSDVTLHVTQAGGHGNWALVDVLETVNFFNGLGW